jgi:predicted alpha/beta superfamily hydrolase
MGMVLFFLPVLAQHKLRVEVINTASFHKDDAIFIVGSFNNWNPRMDSFQLHQENNKWVIEIPKLAGGIYEFKFTRGSWATVECNKTGADINNKIITLSADTTLYYAVEAWKDDFATVEKKHTASANVKLVDSAFYMPQLKRSRRIMIYLPDGYSKTAKRYPVLYMHDGQNLFDDYSSGFGEWGVDECLDSLTQKGKAACIVVAIDNGPRRLNEYNPFYFERFGEGEGEQYVNFIAKSLKPFIDKQYRTLVNKENTIIAGSSMGGLISYYAILKYPEVFGKAGIFSPAFWTADSIQAMTDSLGNKISGRLFFYMGGLEGDHYVKDMLDISENIGGHSTATIYNLIDAEGRHNEQAWQKWFGEFILWITANGNNYVIKNSD